MSILNPETCGKCGASYRLDDFDYKLAFPDGGCPACMPVPPAAELIRSLMDFAESDWETRHSLLTDAGPAEPEHAAEYGEFVRTVLAAAKWLGRESAAEFVREDCPVQPLMDPADDLDALQRLEYLRSQIDQECISQGEIMELQGLAWAIDPGDVQLLEWAGIPEFFDPVTGPWNVGAMADGTFTVDYQARTVAVIDSSRDDAEDNARLIAAAPDLLQALNDLLECDNWETRKQAINLVRMIQGVK